MQARETVTVEELDTPRDVLEFARLRRRDADRAEVDILVAAVTWAEQHPVESIALAATWTVSGFGGGVETGIPLAGPGAPLVAEFCIAELATALKMSTDSGRNLVAAGLELKYRLARTWTRTTHGDLPVWRARRIAEATIGLSREAAAFVDAQVAPFAHKVGPAATDRLVAEAIARFMPDQALQDAERAAESRYVRIDHTQVSFDGTSRIEGELDLADALDLDAALTRGAEALKTAGSDASLDVRRAMAAGDLARRQLTLDLTAQNTDDQDTADGVSTSSPNGARGSSTKAEARQVVLYVHLSDSAITDSSTGLELARVENRNRVVTADQVRGWCANPDTQVTVKPVIDLAEHIATTAYEIPDRLTEQTDLRDHTCVFPWCTRAARRCDHDHVIPHDAEHPERGPTCSGNIAALCRRHHRLKTHTTWTYTVLEPGTYLWRSPHGYHYLRDNTGTQDVTRTHPGDLGSQA